MTMAIDPALSMGWVEGFVTDLRTGEPLQATIIAEGQPYTVTSDLQTGYYKLWLEPGTYSLNASAIGYLTQAVEVVVSTQVGTLQDVALLLDAPWMQFSPTNLDSIQLINQIVTETLTISNNNGLTFTYAISPGPFIDDFNNESNMWEYTYDSYRDANEGYAVLTPLENSQVGIVWFTQEITQPFVVKFRYRVGGGNPAGDGFVFMFYKNSDYIPGTEGSCLGFGGSDFYCTAEGYGIEFDGFDYGNNEPSDHHIALIKDDVWTHLASVDDFRVKDNQWHQVQISVNENGLIVSLDGEVVLTWEGEFDYTYSNLGFSAATAAALDWHIIDDFSLSSGGELPGWLRIEPLLGMIPANRSQPVQVIFNSNSLLPDTYTTTIAVTSNDPLLPVVEIPVTMTVTEEIQPAAKTSPMVKTGWLPAGMFGLIPLIPLFLPRGRKYLGVG